MKKTIFVATFLIADEYTEQGFRIKHCAHDTPFDSDYMEDYGWIFIVQQEVEIDEPSYDVRELLLKGLKAEERKLVAEYAKSKASIEDRVSKLMALEVLS